MQHLRISEPDLSAWVTAQSGELWAAALDLVEDMVFVKNLEGMFLYNNAAHLGFLGKTREQVAGRTDFDLFPADEAEGFFAHDTRLLETERPVVSAHPAQDDEGRAVIDIALKTIIQGPTGETLGLIGIVKRVLVGEDPVACRAQVKAIVRRVLAEQVSASQLAALDQSVAALWQTAKS